VKGVIAPLGVPHRVLLTKVDPRRMNDAMSAQATLMEQGIPVFNCLVRAYAAYEHAVLGGVPISQYKGKNSREGATDYRKVVDELEREWGKK
jgi:chromosome partitioning protein